MQVKLNSNFILISVFTFFLIFVGYIRRQNQLLDENFSKIKTENLSKKKKSILITEDTYRKSTPYKLDQKSDLETDKIIEPDLKDFLKERTENAIKSFKQEAFFEMSPPTTFDYIKLDLDKNMAGIYGYDPINKARVTAIAYAGRITSDQVIDILKTNSDYLPNLSKTKIENFGPEIKLPATPNGSGLNPGSLWNGKLDNGDQFAAIFLPRKDNKGVYFTFLTGTKAYFDSNDGGFDHLYTKVKALPAPDL